MVNLSECFQMVGTEGCIDVATSLGMQGFTSDMGEISIPVYGPFFLKILVGSNCGFICSSLPEVNAVRQLNTYCGTVAITLNLLEMDMLTLIGGLLTYTPNTEANMFLNPCAVDLVNTIANLGSGVIEELANLAGMPLPDGFYDGMVDLTEVLGEIIEHLFNMAIEQINNDLGSFGIEVRPWEELYDFYTEVKESGEMQEMAQLRREAGAAIL